MQSSSGIPLERENLGSRSRVQMPRVAEEKRLLTNASELTGELAGVGKMARGKGEPWQCGKAFKHLDKDG